MVNRVRMLDVCVFFACSFFIVYLDERGNFSLIFKMELNPSRSADDNNITSVSSFGFTFDKKNRFLSIIEYDTQIQTMYTERSTLVAINAIDSEQTTQPKLNSIEKRFNHQMNG